MPFPQPLALRLNKHQGIIRTTAAASLPGPNSQTKAESVPVTELCRSAEEANQDQDPESSGDELKPLAEVQTQPLELTKQSSLLKTPKVIEI